MLSKVKSESRLWLLTGIKAPVERCNEVKSWWKEQSNMLARVELGFLRQHSSDTLGLLVQLNAWQCYLRLALQHIISADLLSCNLANCGLVMWSHRMMSDLSSNGRGFNSGRDAIKRLLLGWVTVCGQVNHLGI